MRTERLYLAAGLALSGLMMLSCSNTPPAVDPDYTAELGACVTEPFPDRWIANCTARIEAEPGNDNAYRFRGYGYFQSGQFDLARADIKRALELDPGDWENHHALGMVEMIDYNFNNALVSFNRSMSLEPNGWFSRGVAGMTYFYMGDFEQAVTLLKENIDLYGDELSESRLCMSLSALGRLDEADSVCEFDLRSEADSMIHEAAAYFAFRSGDLERARIRYAWAFRHWSHHPWWTDRWDLAQMNYGLSVVYRYQGDESEADRLLAEARELDPRIEERMAKIPFTPVQAN